MNINYLTETRSVVLKEKSDTINSSSAFDISSICWRNLVCVHRASQLQIF